MNISKNILSLGFIAVISGVSTAQTYTATAGTNGITDIQSDYSMSTGDGASVSVDVPLEFELPKKVAIAVSPDTTRSLPVNTMFEGIIPITTATLSGTINTEPLNATWTNLSKNYFDIVGGIYANTEAVVTADCTDYIHETDSNSIIKPRKSFHLGAKDSSVSPNNYFYGYVSDDNDSTTTKFPASITMDATKQLSQDNKAALWFYTYLYLDTIDSTDRAGKYLSTATITVSTL